MFVESPSSSAYCYNIECAQDLLRSESGHSSEKRIIMNRPPSLSSKYSLNLSSSVRSQSSDSGGKKKEEFDDEGIFNGLDFG
jgi:hypothetical protein